MGEVITFGAYAVAVDTAVAAALAALLLVAFVVALASRSRMRRAREIAEARAQRAERRAEDATANAVAANARAEQIKADAEGEMQRRMAELTKAQGEIKGQVHGLSERLDGFGKRVGESMVTTAKHTQDGLMKLGERLAVIDKAQQTITSLSSQVVELQHILADKQTRGAFGQARMEAIVRDGLPTSGYAFQPTLSTGTRPDCLILFPEGTPDLVVDAKFPLEAWNLMREAETPEATKTAESQFRRDTVKHITDIAERYFVPGETQETAFMFVPSEAIFADIHERFEDIIQRAHRTRVVLVSPSLLMLSVQVVMSLLRDARMREQAHVIQDEVMKLMEDVGRLDERVKKLQTHFAQAGKDIEGIAVSSRKITARGAAIAEVEIDDGEPPQAVASGLAAADAPSPRRSGPARDNLPELPFSHMEEV